MELAAVEAEAMRTAGRRGPAEPEGVFTAPWQGRAFALAVSLARRGLLPWRRFQRELAARIEAWEREHPDPEDTAYPYYEIWLATLEEVLVDLGICAREELRTRASESTGHPAAAPVAARRAPIAVDPGTSGRGGTPPAQRDALDPPAD